MSALSGVNIVRLQAAPFLASIQTGTTRITFMDAKMALQSEIRQSDCECRGVFLAAMRWPPTEVKNSRTHSRAAREMLKQPSAGRVLTQSAQAKQTKR